MAITSGLGTSALVPAGLGFRNAVINGNMRIAQRGTSAVSTTDSFPVDRWKMGIGTTGAWTAQQIPASTTPTPAGFDYSVKFTKTTGSTPSSSDYNYIVQYIEGNNCFQFGWGTANAKPAVLSFWVKSGQTGTFGGSLRNGASTFYAYCFTYTINASDTWEYKTISIPAITSGTWSTDSSVGISIFFDLGSGANAKGTANSVVSGNFISASGTSQYPTNTSGGNMFFTGVQLEQNYQATPFEQRQISTELSLCRRYYQWIQSIGNGCLTGVYGNAYANPIPHMGGIRNYSTAQVTLSSGSRNRNGQVTLYPSASNFTPNYLYLTDSFVEFVFNSNSNTVYGAPDIEISSEF